MKKIFRSFTFWFFSISIFIILINSMGYDYKNILLIGLNPILNIFLYLEHFRNSIGNDVSNYNLYIMHLITFIIYGGIIDMLAFPIKSMVKIIKSSNINKEF